MYSVLLGEFILEHSDNLSKTLQNPSLSSSEDQQLAELTRKTIENQRSDDHFDLFWSKTLSIQGDVNDPVLPRRRRAPARYSTGTGESYHPTDPKELSRKHYFECLDLVISFIKNKFDQPSFHHLIYLENLLLKSARREYYSEELKFVLDFYLDDFDASNLATHLQLSCTKKYNARSMHSGH